MIPMLGTTIADRSGFSGSLTSDFQEISGKSGALEMGGLLSGRTTGGGKGKIEAARALDISRLMKAGVFRDGWSGGWQWSRDGEKVASISMIGGRDLITLSFQFSRGSSAPKSVRQTVEVEWRPCRYGGERPYFRCSGRPNGKDCGRAVQKLYGAGHYFHCRHCYRLVFASQSEDSCDRAQRKADRVRTMLAGQTVNRFVFPRRPNGMWQRTYDRHIATLMNADMLLDERLHHAAERLSRQLDGATKGFW
jgi:hypothetical protein